MKKELIDINAKVDITFPVETIVHTILAEHHLASAHDSLVDTVYEKTKKTDSFKEAVWSKEKFFFINDDNIMNCLYSMSPDFLNRIKETMKLNWDELKIEGENIFVDELSETEKILYAMVEAVKEKYPQFKDCKQGCYTTEKILGSFYLAINFFCEKDQTYMTMNVSLNDLFDGVSW